VVSGFNVGNKDRSVQFFWISAYLLCATFIMISAKHRCQCSLRVGTFVFEYHMSCFFCFYCALVGFQSRHLGVAVLV